MPMTKRQLEQVEEDYAGYLPKGAMVIAVREQPMSTALDKCDICDRTVYQHDKEIVFDVGPSDARVSRFRMLVCRRGVSCRQRAEKQRGDALVRKSAYVPGSRSYDVIA